MHPRPQFGMRENPASDRRHGSRQVVHTQSDRTCIEQQNANSSPPAPAQPHSPVNPDSNRSAALPHAATGPQGGGGNTVCPAVSALLPNTRTGRDFELLIASSEAARLLGNIHVKTLQRYARRGKLPGYQIGGHWYFRASELDAWLRSRLNSSCHPCRLQED